MKIQAIKKKIFEVIEPCDDSNQAGRAVDIFIVALIVINIVLVITETFFPSGELKSFFHGFEIFSVAVFTVEYILRIWTADLMFPGRGGFKSRVKYIVSFMALIDLFAILPFYMPLILPLNLFVMRSLRIVRLLRLLKVHRYTSVLSTIGDVFKKKASQLISSSLIIFLLLLITSVLMHDLEHAAQPDKFTNTFSSLWWAISTVTTVGYGDIYPITPGGRILSGIISFLSIGLIAIPTGIISAGFVEQIGQSPDKDGQPHDEKCFCPYCGHKLDK